MTYTYPSFIHVRPFSSVVRQREKELGAFQAGYGTALGCCAIRRACRLKWINPLAPSPDYVLLHSTSWLPPNCIQLRHSLFRLAPPSLSVPEKK